MIVDDPVGIAPGASSVADDLPGNFALWINTKVNAAQRHFCRQMRFGSVVFFGVRLVAISKGRIPRL